MFYMQKVSQFEEVPYNNVILIFVYLILFRKPKKCENDHKCKKICWMECETCTEVVTKTFPCGHTVTTVCSENRCTVEVDVDLPNCGHSVKKPCYMKLDEFQCTEPCEDRFPCGHSCVLRCHKINDPDHLEVRKYACCNY